MDRLLQRNVLAMSGRAVEAAGDIDVLLLDKTGTITLGNRMATEFVPAPGVALPGLADAAQLASLADETPEGRSIVVLAKEKFNLRGRDLAAPHARFVPFTAQTRMSGVDLAAFDGQPARSDPQGRRRKRPGLGRGAGGHLSRRRSPNAVDAIARDGGTPLVVAEGREVLGRHLPQGRGQGRHQGALRPAPRHGHPHRDDHRRQSAHRRRHRRRVRRRRLPRPGHARR